MVTDRDNCCYIAEHHHDLLSILSIEGSTREHHDADVQDGELLVAIRRNDTGFVHKAMEEGLQFTNILVTCNSWA